MVPPLKSAGFWSDDVKYYLGGGIIAKYVVAISFGWHFEDHSVFIGRLEPLRRSVRMRDRAVLLAVERNYGPETCTGAMG
jgi:hypothetical protein